MSVPLERLSALIPPEPPRPEGLAALIWRAERLVDPRRLLALALGPLSRRIHARALEHGGLTQLELDGRLAAAQAGIRRAGTVSLGSMSQALALLAEVAARTTGMRPYPVQLRGAMAAQLGFLIEMQTGEGKSLTAALAAALAAWTGRPCHVLTANVYLADRDAASFSAFYQACGLTVAAVRDTDPPPARGSAYAADVVYTTAKEMLADLLRDAILMGRAPARALEPQHPGLLRVAALGRLPPPVALPPVALPPVALPPVAPPSAASDAPALPLGAPGPTEAPSAPVFAAATAKSLATASICATTRSGASSSTRCTPIVFCAVTSVSALVPYTSK